MRVFAALAFTGFALASLASGVWLALKFELSAASVVLAALWFAAASIVIYVSRFRASYVIFVALGLGLLARLVLIYGTNGAVPPMADPHIFDVTAKNFALGRGYFQNMEGYLYQAAYPPLYPILLAAIYRITDFWTYSQFFLNIIIDCATAGVLIFLGKRWIGTQRSVIAAAIYFIWPSVLFGSVIPQKEGLATALVLICILIASRFRSKNETGLGYGFSSGFLALTQPAFLTLAGTWIFLISLSDRRFSRLVWAALGLTLVLSPWILRNWQALGGFVPLTTSSGINLYMHATGEFPSRLYALPEIELSRQSMALGWEAIRADPTAFLFKHIKATYIGFTLEHAYIEHFQRMLGQLRFSPAVMPAFLQLPWIVLWAACAGAVWKRRIDQFWVLIVLGF